MSTLVAQIQVEIEITFACGHYWFDFYVIVDLQVKGIPRGCWTNTDPSDAQLSVLLPFQLFFVRKKSL